MLLDVDIIYDEGPIDSRPAIVTPRQTSIILLPGDVVYGDADEGAIDAAPASRAAMAQRGQPVSAHGTQDLIFTDDDMGGGPVDLSAFDGRSNISAAELAGAQPEMARDLTNVAQQFELE